MTRQELLFVFTGIVSFQFHPGMKKEDRLSAPQCAVLALDFMKEFDELSEVIWPGSVQRSERVPRS